jgi:hypothetical protein
MKDAAMGLKPEFNGLSLDLMCADTRHGLDQNTQEKVKTLRQVYADAGRKQEFALYEEKLTNGIPGINAPGSSLKN